VAPPEPSPEQASPAKKSRPELKPVLDRLREQLRQWRAAQNDVAD